MDLVEGMQADRSAVVINHLPLGIDLRRDYVALPRNYGSPAYFTRPDIQAIYCLVEQNLTELDARLHFTERLAGRRVMFKPNLVTVYHQMGLVEEDYPESTDPRLLDAVLAFFKRFTSKLVIVESSGRGVPTRGSFAVAGIDRLVRYHGADLIALEEQPTLRYFLPQAAVQKEIIVPAILAEVVSEQAFFVSLPKLKTNLYTGVTLGFKNAMGLLPYNLRQRGHHYALDQKLVDILQLSKPDLTIIDGLVGGEGNCPAPVDPVDSRVMLSGNNCLETDRVAARMMGFDPDSILLIRAADGAGFADPQVEIIGEQRVTPFRPADPSLMSPAFCQAFPHVRVLVGHQLPGAPLVTSRVQCSPELARQMEMACRGGCLATTRFAFEMFQREGQRLDFSLVVLIGSGFELDGQHTYLDADGQPYSLAEIEKLPGRKLVVGSCSSEAAHIADRYIEGCMPFPNSPHAALHRLTGTHCAVLSLKNRHLFPLLLATLHACENRKRLFRAGHRLDCPLPTNHSLLEPPRLLTSEEQTMRAVPMEWPPLTKDEIRAACAAENRAVLATFLG
jgi:uncharacterized protein (DUF362 family)